MGDWCLIESDPGVFTELVDKIGCKGVIFDEVWDMDMLGSSSSPEEVFGLVFLFKCNDAPTDRAAMAARIPTSPPPGLFFAKQVIHNACATQAILSILMNSESLSGKLSKELTDFKSFTSSFDPSMRGLAISNQDLIRTVHNSFARQSSFDFEKDDKPDKEDSFHFVAYIPHKGKVYELDGLQSGPMLIGDIPTGGFSKNAWLNVVKPEIKQRMEKYQAQGNGEIRFNLLSVQEDPAFGPELEILKSRYLKQRIAIKLVSMDEDVELEDEDLEDDDAPDGVLSFDELPDDVVQLKAMLKKDCEEKIASLSVQIKDSLEKKAKWRKENTRRRHDYVPFILCALKQLATQGALLPAYAAAKEAHKEAVEKAAAEKAEKA